MDPLETDDCNMVYTGDPAAGVRDLPCRRERPGEIHAFYRPDEAELKALNEGGIIRLRILTEPIPPVGLDVMVPAPEITPAPGFEEDLEAGRKADQ